MSGPTWELTETEDLVSIRTPAVRIDFRRERDRWTHAIGPADGPPRVASIESGPDDDPSRVVSPVYQEIQHHSGHDADHRVSLLLTGLLHKHHFSAVLGVETDPDGAVRIDFDVADRCRDAFSLLAATYEIRTGASELEAADDEAVRWRLAGAVAPELSLQAFREARLAAAEKGPRAMQAQVVAKLAPGGFTHRLHYRWTWASFQARTR